MTNRLCCRYSPSSYTNRLQPLFHTGKKLSWADISKFEPSSNIVPPMNVPVLYLDDNKNLIIRPMEWGIEIVNMWIIGTNRQSPVLHDMWLDTMLYPPFKKSYFNQLLNSKKSCAIVCDGFYKMVQKRPSFFYNSKNEFNSSLVTPNWKENDWTKKGPPVMLLAGVYSSTVIEGDGLGRNWEEVFSCSIISKKTSSRTDPIQDGSPILLDTEKDIMDWLDLKNTDSKKALQTLRAVRNNSLSYYEVGDQVNELIKQKPINQERDCHFPISCFPRRNLRSNNQLTAGGRPSNKRKCAFCNPPSKRFSYN